MDKKRKLAMYTVAPVIIFILTYFICYMQIISPKSNDYTVHMKYALSLDKVLELTHFGWQFVCWLFYACLPVSINAAAALTTALFNALTAILVIWMINRCMGERIRSVFLPSFMTLVVLLVGPLYLRFYNPRYYMGQGSPNIWHNPTTIAVRPFMILITILTVDYWACGEDETITLGGKVRKKSHVYWAALMILLFISTIIKPSYLMVYFPVCAIAALIRLIRSRGRLFGRLILQHLYFLPSLLAFLWQYVKIYLLGGNVGSEDVAGIQIAFFKVARMTAPSVTVSLILRMAFPFLVIVIWRKKIFKDKLFQLVFAQYLVGLATTWTFAETGSRVKHGNFGWGNILACSLLWMFCLIFYIKEWNAEGRKCLGYPKSGGTQCEGAALGEKVSGGCGIAKYAVPAVILLWHLLAGIAYYISIICTKWPF